MSDLKSLQIKLTPHMRSDYYLESCDVHMEVENPDFKAGDSLANLWNEVAWVPGCELTDKGLCASDARGTLPLKLTVDKDQTGFDCRNWRPERNTEGNVKIDYTFIPQNGSKLGRSHPFFDTVSEENGAVVCGVTSIVRVGNEKYHVSFGWDLSDAPKGTKGACTYGEGHAEFDGDWQAYTFFLMIVGKYKRAVKNGRFSIYWLSDNLPDRENIEAQLPVLLNALFDYFGDKDGSYSVFFRHEPWDVSGGGTQLPNAFVCGYSDACPLSMKNNLSVLAHETTHRWTNMRDLGGEGTWFQEGMAEYCSTMVSLRSGIIDKATAAEWLTEKMIRYYCNSYQNLSNEELYKRTWSDSANPEIQEASYGRGLVYLTETDYEMKKKTGGKKSVDDLIFEMVDITNQNGECELSDWIRLIERELGPSAVSHFNEVMSGRETIEPNCEWFDGMFTFKRGPYTLERKQQTYDNAVLWSVR